LFPLDTYLKITEGVQLFAMPFPQKSFAFILRKNGLGYTLGDFFTMSSGHPDRKPNTASQI
jgi:hypothetical protein